ncbi:MAG: hypothetical protein A3B34_03385 [Candidatus Sungbacteria bacterium RIFCSPLOWO2_01_FULL_54_21]|uniref:Uncharacterized protein n=1 Tax=Candidatus Sungbacteria bacterium RIFCSPLOWO2_01_FULL_54_21 TaxID=1802279 RepID=A0A1G2L7G0_9BACT|nr:MAG: hypothetical protein A2679_00505 [Candidatus Sungbacteria bacterium RIFCSPHIGHO2_01_FULL_54_26]OHA06772.1 MAG: hypothetical protein A3B34_03385 [Candidatus Sungbacteria bacterium RIFCSPLOWO2_01_FULL_54_21]
MKKENIGDGTRGQGATDAGNMLPSDRNFGSGTRFRGDVLRRIYRVWLVRKLAPILLIEIAVLSALLYGLGRLVFVERVFANALTVLFREPSGIASFAVSAFLHAPVTAKLFSVALVILLALLIRLVTQGMLRFILVRENYFSRADGGIKRTV